MADYKQIKTELQSAGISENHLQWYGFVLGLLCRDYDPSSHVFSYKLKDHEWRWAPYRGFW